VCDFLKNLNLSQTLVQNLLEVREGRHNIIKLCVYFVVYFKIFNEMKD